MFSNSWNLFHIRNYVDNLLYTTLYIDIHAYSLCNCIRIRTQLTDQNLFCRLYWTRSALKSQKCRRTRPRMPRRLLVFNCPQTHSLPWYIPLPLNFVHCNGVLIQVYTGAGGDRGCTAWWICVQRRVTFSPERGTIPLRTRTHLVYVMFSCSESTAYTYALSFGYFLMLDIYCVCICT